MDGREMLFLIFGLRKLGLWEDQGLFSLTVGPQCPFPSTGDPSGFFQPLESSGSVRSDFIYLPHPKQTLGIGGSCCFCWNLPRLRVWCCTW